MQRTITITLNSDRIAFLLAGLVIGLLSAVAVVAVADGDPTTDDVPRTLPYQGVLEIDGEPLDANGANGLNIMFMLYDGQASEEPVYRQTVRVDVYSGRFTTTIGPVGLDESDQDVVISDIITNADDLYLGMTLLGDLQNPDDDVQLANRQRIHAAPYSMWTTSATNIAVASNATVGNTLNVGGDATVAGSTLVEGDLTVGGDVALPANTINSDEVANGTILYEDLNAAIIGEGLDTNANALEVDGAWLDGRIRSWVRNHCTVQLGWRDVCTNCSSAPERSVNVRANGNCIGGGGGAAGACRDSGRWGGFNTRGTVNSDDMFYIRFVCD